jgi:hypothetical protein
VYVYNLSGIRLKQFRRDLPENNLFSDIRYLAANTSIIYVTDFDKGILVLDKDGYCEAVLEGQTIQSACGCSFTAAGNLLLYDHGCRRVLQYGINGKCFGTVFTPSSIYTNVWGSQLTICCNKQMTKLLLAGYNDTITVYSID